MSDGRFCLNVRGIPKNKGDEPFGLFFDDSNLCLTVPSRMNLGLGDGASESEKWEYIIPLESINDSVRNRILGYLRLLDTVKSGKDCDVLSDPSKYVEKENFTSIESMEWILSDYLRNGIPRTKMKIRENNDVGKINWKCTIQSCLPLFSTDNLIFTQFVSDVSKRIEDLISHAYVYCVNESSRYIGWLWELPDRLIENPEEDELEPYILAIQELLERTFVDSKRIRLIHMLNILISDHIDIMIPRGQKYSANDFDGMYERMISDVLGNVSKDNLEQNYYARMKYTSSQYVPKPLRPDAILETDSQIVIIDAKYYRESNLPETSDVMKQISYAEHAELLPESDGKVIRNCFILPKITSEIIKYETKTECSWRSMEKEYDSVHVIYLDFMTLFDVWCGISCLKKDDLQNKLIRLLNSF